MRRMLVMAFVVLVALVASCIFTTPAFGQYYPGPGIQQPNSMSFGIRGPSGGTFVFSRNQGWPQQGGWGLGGGWGVGTGWNNNGYAMPVHTSDPLVALQAQYPGYSVYIMPREYAPYYFDPYVGVVEGQTCIIRSSFNPQRGPAVWPTPPAPPPPVQIAPGLQSTTHPSLTRPAAYGYTPQIAPAQAPHFSRQPFGEPTSSLPSVRQDTTVSPSVFVHGNRNDVTVNLTVAAAPRNTQTQVTIMEIRGQCSLVGRPDPKLPLPRKTADLDLVKINGVTHTVVPTAPSTCARLGDKLPRFN